MLTTTIAALAEIEDRDPSRDNRITTSLALRPEDHLRIAKLALDLGLDRASLVRRALVIAGVLAVEEGAR